LFLAKTIKESYDQFEVQLGLMENERNALAEEDRPENIMD